jgi:O-succinylbenzoate synthase
MSYRFSFRRYRLPLRTPVRTAHGLWSEREGMILRLESEDGSTGFGEVAPIPWFGTETMAEAEERCRKMGDEVPDDVLDAVPEKMGCVRFAFAAAIAGVGRGHRRRLGGEGGATRTSGPEQAGFGDPALQQSARVPLTALLPAGRDAIGILAERLEAGWLCFKWKVGVGDMDQELGLLDELMERLPGYAKLRLDANGAWTRRQAARWIERCAGRAVEFVEQPVAPADVDSLMGLAHDYPVKLALDEAVVRLAEAREWQARGWPGVFVIKPALAGPLSELAAWAATTRADVVLSSAIETALGRAAILQHASEHGSTLLRRAPGFGVGGLFGDRRWDGPFLGPLLDDTWSRNVNPEEPWNALS